MNKPLPFDFEIPVEFFEKADAEPGKQRRVRGVCSLESKDRQKETILQTPNPYGTGLDFSDFKSNGWLNDNHSRATDGILGYPETVQYFKKGQKMPNGDKADVNCHYLEGHLLETDKADRVWALGKALAKTKRSLGFSVEGKIERRVGPNGKIIAQALVRNVAITNCPVHTGAKLEILAKSLQVMEDAEPDELEKMITVGTSGASGGEPVAGSGPRTGEGAAQLMSKESLESKQRPFKDKDKDEDEDEKKKSLTKSQAFALVSARLPNATKSQIERFIQLTQKRKAAGQL